MRAVRSRLKERERPFDERELVKEIDAQAGRCQRGHNLAQAVAPAVLELLGDLRAAVRIRALRGEADWLGMTEVGIPKPQVSHAVAVIEDPSDGMDLGDVEEAAGFDEMSGDFAHRSMSGNQPSTPREV